MKKIKMIYYYHCRSFFGLKDLDNIAQAEALARGLGKRINISGVL